MNSPKSIIRIGILFLILTTMNTGCQPASPDQDPTQPLEIAPTFTDLPAPTLDPMIEKRENMVKVQIAARGIQDPRVLAAMETVPRHEFVPDSYLSKAYADHPLPIGFGQTISQPYIVALMTEVLQLEEGDRVLEIGTGSGYQAAILGELDLEVYTMEIIPELATKADQRLERLGYRNIQVRFADGYFGWEEQSPFDAIIVTAAPDHLPLPLIQQLSEGARMVIPIGPIGAVQSLWLFEMSEGELLAKNLGAVQFVPLTGEH